MESLPIDIVLVRHGESEINLAHQNEKLWTPEFRARHASNYMLTDVGRKQAEITAQWIKENIYDHFDAYFCSNYARAMETAGIMDFPNAFWRTEFYLREQDKGVLEGKSHSERQEFLKHATEKDRFYIAPLGGESLAQVCLRVDRILSMWQKSFSGQRVICVCHESIMTAFRVRLERMSQMRFREIENSTNPYDKMHRCQILHYSRRDPFTAEILWTPQFLRSSCAVFPEKAKNKWERIAYPTYTSEQLQQLVDKIPQLVNNQWEAEKERGIANDDLMTPV